MKSDKWPRYDTPFYFHFRLKDLSNPRSDLTNGVTVCFLPKHKDESVYLSAGIAVCSNVDNYCKRIGRNISFARAKIGGVGVASVINNYDELAKCAKTMANEVMRTRVIERIKMSRRNIS
jgi:hypothetical protein